MYKRSFITLILMFTIIPVLYSTDIFVDINSGDDTNIGTSWSEAVKTIQKGADLACLTSESPGQI